MTSHRIASHRIASLSHHTTPHHITSHYLQEHCQTARAGSRHHHICCVGHTPAPPPNPHTHAGVSDTSVARQDYFPHGGHRGGGGEGVRSVGADAREPQH
eukprot:1177794-Prorocentrum_minimum.AAC.1